MKKILLIVFFIALIVAIFSGTLFSQVDEPEYTVMEKVQQFEIREYAPRLIAEVSVSGDRKTAANKGFRILAEYIFGNNLPADKIAMTAPVTQQPQTKIAMTAPVLQEPEGEKWKIQFVMPSEYSLDTIPKPNNDEITLKQIASEQYLVIRFSGSTNIKNLETHRSRLVKYVDENNIKTIGEPIYAFYNPPWTLPFLKRNEVMIKIQS